jgi:hypothetical protein
MERTQEKLRARGTEISNADLQAALWYYEKRLNARLGVSSKRAAPVDYAIAAKELLDGTLTTATVKKEAAAKAAKKKATKKKATKKKPAKKKGGKK